VPLCSEYLEGPNVEFKALPLEPFVGVCPVRFPGSGPVMRQAGEKESVLNLFA
jgi:hypothetical protein